MDNISLQRFNHILLKPIDSLSLDEISFLRARRNSLTAMQIQFYSEILDKKEETIKIEAEIKTEEPKKTVKKK